MNSQEKRTHKTPIELEKIESAYSQNGLKLSEKKISKFVQIVHKCNKRISRFNINLTPEEKREFNKINKIYDLEIFKILSKEEWNQYKKTKKNVEPYKNYK